MRLWDHSYIGSNITLYAERIRKAVERRKLKLDAFVDDRNGSSRRCLTVVEEELVNILWIKIKLKNCSTRVRTLQLITFQLTNIVT